MGWPHHSLSAIDKFFADLYETRVEELALQYQQKGIKIDHDAIAKKHFKKLLRDALISTEMTRVSRKRRHGRTGP
jgi:hypothetical protein